LHEKPARARKFYATIAVFTIVAMGLNLSGFNPLKSLVFNTSAIAADYADDE
jgi:hypothetical protein